jgi:hypothetical protein
VHITDIWRSTDGGAHTVSAHYDQWIEGFDYEPFGQTQVGLELPWLSSSFQTFTSDVVFPGPASAPASIFVRDQNTAPDGSTAFPRGAVSFDFAPHEVHRASNREFALRDEGIGVPAAGSHTVRQDFVIGTTQAEVSAKAAMNVDRFVPPTVSITAPATGATSHTQQLMVSGKATDNVGVSSLTVNGANVAVGSGGAWSTTVPLKVGHTQITAVAKDAAGNSSQAHITVTYPRPELSKLKVAKTTLAKLLRSRKLKLRVAINDVSTVRLSGKLRITGKSKAGFKTATVNFAEPASSPPS